MTQILLVILKVYLTVTLASIIHKTVCLYVYESWKVGLDTGLEHLWQSACS